ncbi:Uncharacterised protein [Vibrio cholerae]|nr:Uncharacterised protein [Vibrio cholerae]
MSQLYTYARLRGWQRINTKLNHNNQNHCGSMGWKRPRLTVPLEAFVSHTYVRFILFANLLLISIFLLS